MKTMIDKDTIDQARNADIIIFFGQHYRFTFTCRDGAYRCRQHPSLAVKNDRLSWFWHSRGLGGFGPLDYLIKAENMSFREAVKTVMGMSHTTVPTQVYEKVNKPKTLVLPEKAGVQLRLYDYLCNKRNISSNIVNSLILEKKLYEDKRGNVVFVGFDERDKPQFASLRSTHSDFRIDCSGSNKKYGFCIAYQPSELLYIFESAIDAMSLATIESINAGNTVAWKQRNYLSLSGTSDTAIPLFLNQHKTVKELVFCLDNDPTGREAATKMVHKYAQNGYRTQVKLPQHKDFNMDLQTFTKQLQTDNTRKLSNDISI